MSEDQPGQCQRSEDQAEHHEYERGHHGDDEEQVEGRPLQPFLTGSCISDLDFAPDGSAWVVALDPTSKLVGTYVITPEAVVGAG